MSKNDYIALAAMLAKYPVPTGLMEELIAYLKRDNPRFDAKRLLQAAKNEEGR